MFIRLQWQIFPWTLIVKKTWQMTGLLWKTIISKGTRQFAKTQKGRQDYKWNRGKIKCLGNLLLPDLSELQCVELLLKESASGELVNETCLRDNGLSGQTMPYTYTASLTLNSLNPKRHVMFRTSRHAFYFSVGFSIPNKYGYPSDDFRSVYFLRKTWRPVRKQW